MLWNKNILVVLLIGAAIYFTIITKFMQFRLFRKIIKVLFKNEKTKDGISSLETFFLGTACRVGAGNIAGVVSAISIGGLGSVFWMWLVALLGSATSFVESSLSVIYREKQEDGSYVGGTPYIIKQRLGLKKLGLVYAIASIICYLGVIQVMSNSITESVASVYSLKYVDIKTFTAVLVSLLVAYIVFINKKQKDSIITVLNKIVPIMAVLYITIVLIVIIMNFTKIPQMFLNIVTSAFNLKNVTGGTIGVVVMNGVKRGLFSNEAGSGNSNYASAAAHINIPAKQGMVQAFGVFIDTLVICSATAFILLLAPKSDLTGMALFQNAVSYHLGSIGPLIVVILMFFFCISTILAVVFYGRSAIYYMNKNRRYNIIYQVLVIAMIYIGGIKQNDLVWSLADFGLGIMTLINILCIIFISKPAIDSLKEYEEEI